MQPTSDPSPCSPLALLDEQLEPCAAKIDRRLQITSHHHAHLARVVAGEGRKDKGLAELRKASDDIRAGATLRGSRESLRTSASRLRDVRSAAAAQARAAKL